MSDLKIKLNHQEQQPLHSVKCAECGKTLQPYEAAGLYDEEWCHLHCVAEAMDTENFEF